MNEIISLDATYSTTRRVVKAEAEVIAELIKQSAKPEDQFETQVFLTAGENRQGEGGLRTKGYFKVGGLISEDAITASSDPVIASANTGHCEEQSNAVIHHEVISPLTPHSSPENKPLITVVTVVYNGEQFLEETILSVINQTYDNVEYIIIDGGSTDGTLDIIKKYEHAIDYWVSEKDKGIYDAMNKGIDLATGEWINFMNADDFLASHDVIQQIASSSYAVSKNISIVYGSLNLINQQGELLSVICNSQELVNKLIKTKMPIPHQAQFSKLTVIKRVNKFKSSYKISADYDLTIRLLKDNTCYQINDLNTASMRLGGISSDPFSSKRMLLEYRQAQVENGLGLNVPFIFSWVRVYIRLFLWRTLGETMATRVLDLGNKILGRKTFWNKALK